MKKRNIFWLLVGLLALSRIAQAACNANIPLTRPDSRYEAVTGATPAGSEVRDKVTGLVWQRCVVGMLWDGTTCTGTASTHDWQQALEVARNATASTAATGATGATAAWRVPNIIELFSLGERACYIPAINTTWFPATPTDRSFWSSSPFRDLPPNFVLVFDTQYGYITNTSKDDRVYVRLVRAGQ